MPNSSYAAEGNNRSDRLDLHQHDGKHDCRNRRCRVQDDTQRTVVSIGVDRVYVRHLDNGEQRKKHQAHQYDCSEGSGPCAAVAARP
jgi:hypothetical protein